MDSGFADKISEECLSCYQNLPKKGKPIPNKEWTLLSSVVMTLERKFTVVAMATGTKCLGRSDMSQRGDIVNDSHAEVLARRCFLRYVYDQIYTFKYTGSSEIIISCNERNQFVINPEVKFHFYSSHVPCGDASIIPKFGSQNKRKLEIVNHTEKRKRKEVLEAATNPENIFNEDSGKQYQRPSVEFSCHTAAFKGTFAEEDLINATTDVKVTDEDLWLNLNNDTPFLSTQSAVLVSDDDVKGFQKGVVNFSPDNVNCKGNGNDNKSTGDITNNQDNRTVNKFSNNFYARQVKDKHYFSSEKASDYKSSENSSCQCVVDENFTSVGCDERVKDCVGEVLDIHRTGARCVEGEDSKLPGALYHKVAAVRTKPGRGDPTLSVSCSDKLARWIACGLQGALLSLLLSRPVVLDSVVIGSGGPYSRDVLERALITRTGTLHRPCLLQSTVVFPHSRYKASPTAKPCPSAILWTRTSHKALEVCVEGKRQGATKKCRDNGRLAVCKLELLRAFISVSGDRYHWMTYREIKASAVHYNTIWAEIKSYLGAWTTKPQHLQDFTLNKNT